MANTALSLYQIEDDLAALINSEEMVPEGTDERLQILDEIAQKTAQAVAKRNNVIRFLRHIGHQIDNIDTEIERLRALRGSYTSGRERVEKYVASVIEQCVEQPKHGPKKLEGTIGVLSLRRNPERTVITDMEKLPDRFKEITVTLPLQHWNWLIDGAADDDPYIRTAELEAKHSAPLTPIKVAIKSGQEVPGADIVFGDVKLVVK